MLSWCGDEFPYMTIVIILTSTFFLLPYVGKVCCISATKSPYDNNVFLPKNLIKRWPSALSKDNIIFSIHDNVPWSPHMIMCPFGLSILPNSLAPLWNNLLSHVMTTKPFFISIQTHDHTHKITLPNIPKNGNVIQLNRKWSATFLTRLARQWTMISWPFNTLVWSSTL